jgi:hypothetical protein
MKKSLQLLLLGVFCFIFPAISNAQSCTPAAATKTNSTKVYVHYMPWFFAPQNPGTGVTSYATNVNASGSWGSHWTNVNSNTANPNTFTTVTDYTGASVQTRNICAHYHPLIGPYDETDTSVLEYHLLLMKLSGIDGVMIDWYGVGGNGASDAGANLLNSNALISKTGTYGLKFGLVMEDAAWKGMTAADSNGSYAVNNYFNSTQYIKLGDMRGSTATNASAPLVCVFGPQQFKMNGQWNTILKGNTKAFLPLYGQASQIGKDAGGTFVWPFPQAGQSGTPPAWYANTSNYYTGNAVTLHKDTTENNVMLGDNVILGTAYQGFNDFYGSGGADQDGIIPRNYGANGNTLTAMLSLYTQNGPVLDAIQLVTWNDFSEGTIIEPTVEFGFQSLDTIQKFTGVPFTENNLKEVYKLFTLRKKYVGNASIQSALNIASCHFIQLDTLQAEAVIDCIASTGSAGSCSATLPLNLLSFTGQSSNGKIQLQWQTANELNTDHFEVDKSTNGVNFSFLTNVNAVGSGNNSYTNVDAQPNIGNNYYRLKIIDDNGNFIYSNIVIVKIGSKGSIPFIVYPNPTSNQLVVQYDNAAGDAILNIYNTQGQKVLTTSMNGSTKTTIDVSNLAAGNYIIEYNSDITILRDKFVKVN